MNQFSISKVVFIMKKVKRCSIVVFNQSKFLKSVSGKIQFIKLDCDLTSTLEKTLQ